MISVPLELLPVPNLDIEAVDNTYTGSLMLNNSLRGELRRINNELVAYRLAVEDTVEKVRAFNEEQKKKALGK